MNDEDRRWFGNYLKASVQEHLHLHFDEVFAPLDASASGGQLDVLSAMRSLLYCNFLTQVCFATEISTATSRHLFPSGSTHALLYSAHASVRNYMLLQSEL